MRTNTITSAIKVVAITELAILACLFAQAFYEHYNDNTNNGSPKTCAQEFDPGHTDRIKDLVVMDDLFYAEPLANQ